MHVSRLSLTNIRNYRRLELVLPPGPVVLCGENGEGKSNLLEAIYTLAHAKPHRATLERELVSWDALREDLPFARIEATVRRQRGDAHIEYLLQVTRTAGQAEGGVPTSRDGHTSKRIRLNGAPCRSSDLVGEVNVVLFTAEDIELVSGSPSDRRKFLDLLNSQVSREYLDNLAQYTRVVAQRNYLLRAITEGKARESELEVWDAELVKSGVPLVVRRYACVGALARHAQEAHEALTSEREHLGLLYQPNLDGVSSPDAAALRRLFESRLAAARRRELAAGMTLVGPHRDELRFLVNGVDMGVYGSRGQHRTITLAMKLAEAKFIEQEVDEQPVLLLDDVLAELDAPRRARLQDVVLRHRQALITTTELDRFDASFLQRAAHYRVAQGSVDPV